MPQGQSSRHRVRVVGPVGFAGAVALVVVLVVVTLAAIDLRRTAAENPSVAPGTSDSEVAALGQQQYAVRLRVSATGPFAVTMGDRDGRLTNETSETGEEVVVTRVFRGFGPYVSANAQLGIDGGRIRCSIDINGEEFTSNRGSGPFEVIFCGL